MTVTHTTSSRRPWSLWVLAVLMFLLGLFAILPGWAMLMDPSGASLGMSTTWLSNPLFPNYLIPGLFLFGVVGVGSLVVASLLLLRPQWSWAQRVNPIRNKHWVWTIALAMGIFVMLWIAIQVASVTLNSWLQPTIFVVGAVIVLLVLEPGMRRYFAEDPRAIRPR